MFGKLSIELLSKLGRGEHVMDVIMPFDILSDPKVQM